MVLCSVWRYRSVKPYSITLCCVAASIVSWALASFVPTQGSEWLGMISMEVTYLALGTLVGGAIALVRQHI
ncbi:MAG: hypothetical protein UD957_02760 [Evtepia sp.]|nr:hypothetical protein [Evtepia sp.]